MKRSKTPTFFKSEKSENHSKRVKPPKKEDIFKNIERPQKGENNAYYHCKMYV